MLLVGLADIRRPLRSGIFSHLSFGPGVIGLQYFYHWYNVYPFRTQSVLVKVQTSILISDSFIDCEVKMSLSWKLGIPLSLLIIMLITTPYFGTVESTHYSAYAACRKVAMGTKGDAEWKHVRTIQKVVRSWILFSDGSNKLDCRAIGIGPFWAVRRTEYTYSVCGNDASSGTTTACPEDYFGVSP